jgi:ubiquitin-protein ligase
MNSRYRRLYNEYEEILFLFSDHPRIRLIEAIGDPPTRYIFEYYAKGLVETKEGIREADRHRVQVTLGENFPHDMPVCVALDPGIFHPNIDRIAICTEDRSVAGRTIQAVLGFIGREITFQAYNLGSPRNGDAVEWTKANKTRLPLEVVDFTPRSMLEGRSAPSYSVAELEERIAARAAPFAAPCANCGQSSVRICSSGHATCDDCNLYCTECGDDICALCPVRNCHMCGTTVCGACVAQCGQCARMGCPAHSGQCAICAGPRCMTCLAACSACGLPVCAHHLDEGGRCPRCGTSQPPEPRPRFDSGERTVPPMAGSASASGMRFAAAAAPMPSVSPPSVSMPSVSLPSAPPLPAFAPTPPPLPQPVVITWEEALGVPESALIVPSARIEIRPPEVSPVSGKAIASLVFGLVGLPIVGLLTGWFAVGFGISALRRIDGPPPLRGRSLATAGVALGIVDILVWIALSAIYLPTMFAPRFGTGATP